MRYRLRTLLIAVTVCCVVLAWVVATRRMASYHLGEAGLLIAKIAHDDSMTTDAVESWMKLLEAPETKTTRSAGVNAFGKSVVTFHHPPVPGDVLWQTNSSDWEQAIHHRKLSQTYARALWQPWLLISK